MEARGAVSAVNFGAVCGIYFDHGLLGERLHDLGDSSKRAYDAAKALLARVLPLLAAGYVDFLAALATRVVFAVLASP